MFTTINGHKKGVAYQFASFVIEDRENVLFLTANNFNLFNEKTNQECKPKGTRTILLAEDAFSGEHQAYREMMTNNEKTESGQKEHQATASNNVCTNSNHVFAIGHHSNTNVAYE